MKLCVQQLVTAQPEAVREFYADIKNLRSVSPPFPVMIIEAVDTRVVEGREFAITLDFLLFKLKWKSRIEKVVAGAYFVDTVEGRIFTSWRHTHRYAPATGGTLLTDEVVATTAWWLAPFAWLAVRALFQFRRRALEKVLA